MYTIRLALPKDAQYLPAIEASAGLKFADNPKYGWIAGGEGQTEQDHLAFIYQRLEWVAVNDKDQPVGFINTEKLSNTLHICELSVCQDCQGQGIGKRLIEKVIEVALSMKLHEVTLTTFHDVPWNAPFYQYIGFRILQEHELSADLRHIMEQEEDAGLQRKDRCAMIMKIN